MSAFVVSTAHIDYMIRVAIHYKIIEAADATAAGRKLVQANYDSVNYRYNESHPPKPYAFAVRSLLSGGATVNPIWVIKACHCLEYQSCEFEGWEKSGAQKFVEALEYAAITRLPGYDAAPWGIR